MKFLRSKNLSERACRLVIQKKIRMPYESVGSLADLRKTECPSPEDFSSVLRGTGPLNDQEMSDFREIWQALNIPDLGSLFEIYVQLDCCETSDCVFFYFQKLFEATKLYPLWYLTIR